MILSTFIYTVEHIESDISKNNIFYCENKVKAETFGRENIILHQTSEN